MVALLACGGSNATLVYIAPSTATVNAGAYSAVYVECSRDLVGQWERCH
jgi:hypothetical protein